MRFTGFWRYLPVLYLLCSSAVSAVGDEAFIESVVIFNTVCAKCHEAECSGRLSFDEASRLSRDHIIRHYAGASGKESLQRQLFVILNYMKEKCAYYPMALPVPPQRFWGTELLEKMATFLGRNYFIPIGLLSPGSYRLVLKLANNEKVTLHLVSESFEMVVEDCFQSSDETVLVPISIEEAGHYYLRIYPRKPVQILQLNVERIEDG